jgi:hypothetical protein
MLRRHGDERAAALETATLAIHEELGRRRRDSRAIAMLPSPTAAATRFTGPERTSPHAEDARHTRREEVRVAYESPASRGVHGPKDELFAFVERAYFRDRCGGTSSVGVAIRSICREIAFTHPA